MGCVHREKSEGGGHNRLNDTWTVYNETRVLCVCAMTHLGLTQSIRWVGCLAKQPFRFRRAVRVFAGVALINAAIKKG